jgi:hypothetical protein
MFKLSGPCDIYFCDHKGMLQFAAYHTIIAKFELFRTLDNSFIVQAAVITIITYDGKTFTVKATIFLPCVLYFSIF